MSDGTSRVAEQVLEHRSARALRMRALRNLRELQRVAEQHDVARRGPHRERVGERHLPGFVDHQRVDRAVERGVREEPCGSGEELDVRGSIRERRVVASLLDKVAFVLRLLALARLLQTAEIQSLRLRRLFDFVEQVVDRLVAGRRHADAPAAPHEVGDEAGARPRLARPGRTLDEEVALIERRGERSLLRRGRWSEFRTREASRNAGRCARQDVAQRRIAAVVGRDRRCKPRERRRWAGVVRAAWRNGTRQRRMRKLGPAKRSVPVVSSMRDDRPRRFLGRGSTNCLSADSLCCCAGKVSVWMSEFLSGRPRRSGTRPPIASASSSSSSSVMRSRRMKYHHHPGRASRR